MMEDFHFLRPYWLIGVAIAAALLLAGRLRHDARRRWKGVIADHLLAHLVIQPSERWHVRPFHLTAVALAIGAVSAAGPSWTREQPPFVEDRAPLVIAIDVSETMDAIDVTPTRLERAKLKVRDLLALRPGARTAIVAYAGSAHAVLPLTDDAVLIQTYVDALSTKIMPVHGRNTIAALEAIDRVLAREETPGTMLLLTGGVEDSAFDRLRQAMADGHHQPLVLGIGTAEGGPVRTGPQTYLTNAAGARVFAHLDVPALERLRRDTGVPVATITGDGSDVKWIQRRVQSHLQQRQTASNQRWRDEGWWLTLPLVLLSALWFRRGWTIHWSAAGLALMLLSPSAASAQTSPWLNPWLTPDQQGRLALDRGDTNVAAATFEDPMWRGTAFYRAGKYTEALDAFARVNSPESDYNQGNCLARLGKYPEAAARYRAALTARPQFPQATANLALVQKLIPPPKKEDEQDAGDPSEKPDSIVFDDKGKQGKRGPTNTGGTQTADVWMRNIQTSPAELLRRKFAIEAQGRKP
jgi:Ca-activated chloride channel family protein